MALNFQKKSNIDLQDTMDGLSVISAKGHLSPIEKWKLEKILTAWDFYTGYHWQGVPETDTPQVTHNYCRLFVDKYTAFELGAGFTIKIPPLMEVQEVTIDDKKPDPHVDFEDMSDEEQEEYRRNPRMVEKNTADFLEDVWKQNHKDNFCTDLGQTKSVSGEAWIQVGYEEAREDDIFEEFPRGRIRVSIVPTQFCYPKYDEHDKDKVIEFTVMYPITVEKKSESFLFDQRREQKTSLYKRVWTKDIITTFVDGIQQGDSEKNDYGFIPFVHIKNFNVAGRSDGAGDLDDIIPLNVEYNLKSSDVSEIIDYHAAPITAIYGAKIGNLERGANKVWAGLPEKARIENIELNGELGPSMSHLEGLKRNMCELGGISESTLGGAQAISNTSGVAMQYMNLPLIERTKVKRANTREGLEEVNKVILFIAWKKELIRKPENVSVKDFLRTEVSLPDTLPKDTLLELQQIESELKLGLECRHGAMERLGKEDINTLIQEIDQERAKHPELFNPLLQQTILQDQLMNNRSGMENSTSAIEQVRTEITGNNGMSTL